MSRRAGAVLASICLLVAAGALATAAAAAAPSPTPTLSVPAPAATTTAAPGSGEALFIANCSGCHGPHGQGLIGPPQSADAVPSLVADMVDRGGISMPSFVAGRPFPVLSPSQVQAVADYVAFNIADPAARSATADEGGDIFRLYCSGCHSATARGGALSQGRNAPSLAAYPAAEAIAAMIYGRGNMPAFADSTLDTRQQTAVALYVQVLESPPSPGGHGLRWLGPVTEGFASLAGLVLLLALTVWLAWGKSRQVPAELPADALGETQGDAGGD